MVHLQAKRGAGNRFWRLSYAGLFVFNLITTWWIKNSTTEGAVAAIVLNTALMTIPMALYYRARVRWGVVAGLCVWAVAWLLFEKGHLMWDLTWPWLTLGNTFATRTGWVQWYSITGHLGGSAWVLWVNALVFLGFCHKDRKQLAKATAWATAAVLLMLTVSQSMLPWAMPNLIGRVEAVVVQPNIDPYTQKFVGTPQFIPFASQIERMVRLSDSLITPKTTWVLWPETAIDATLNEDILPQDALMQTLQRWVDTHPNLNLVVGATTYKIYEDGQQTGSARFRQGVGYYDIFNTALHLHAGSKAIDLYHKSKLVPGVEGLPYPAFFGPLAALAIDLGGTSGSLGKQPTRTIFSNKDSTERVGVGICYESIFGDFMGDFSRNGAQAIGIITNDAWWGATPGHEQHLLIGRLRAIEQRRYMMRAANTGISGFVDPRGTLIDTLSYAHMGSRRGLVGLTNVVTGYMLWGDAGLLLLVAAFCTWQGRLGYKKRAILNTRA